MTDDAGPALPAPFRSGPYRVRPEWIDSNAHLNLAYYVLLFDLATDALWTRIGLGDALRANGFGTFAAESHTHYRAELREGEEVAIASEIVAVDGKRLHIAHTMARLRDGVVSAMQELMYLSVSLETRRVVPWPEHVAASLQEAAASFHGKPDWVGRRVGVR